MPNTTSKINEELNKKAQIESYVKKAELLRKITNDDNSNANQEQINAMQKLINKGYTELTLRDLENIKAKYNDESYQATIYSPLFQLKKDYDDALKALEDYLASIEEFKNLTQRQLKDLKRDDLQYHLYMAANNEVLFYIKGEEQNNLTFKQFKMFAEILVRTKKGMENPLDKENNLAYQKLYNKVAGQQSFSGTLRAGIVTFLGILTCAVAVGCFIACCIICPPLFAAGVGLGVLGSLIMFHGIKQLGKQGDIALENKELKAEFASNIFNRHLNKLPTTEQGMKEEKTTLKYRLRSFVVN